MAEEKPVTKKDLQQLLGEQTKFFDRKLESQTKTILESVDKKIDEKIDGLAVMMFNAFEANQKYMDKRFDEVNGKLTVLTDQTNKNFSEVKKQIDNVSLSAVDVIREEDFTKLEDRVVVVEEALKLNLKKA